MYRELQRQLGDCPSVVELDWESCFGRCTQGPNVLVREVTSEVPAATRTLAAPRAAGRATAMYNGVTVARVGEIVQGHLVEGRVQRQLVERLGPARDGEA